MTSKLGEDICIFARKEFKLFPKDFWIVSVGGGLYFSVHFYRLESVFDLSVWLVYACVYRANGEKSVAFDDRPGMAEW